MHSAVIVDLGNTVITVAATSIKVVITIKMTSLKEQEWDDAKNGTTMSLLDDAVDIFDLLFSGEMFIFEGFMAEENSLILQAESFKGSLDG